jgi:2-oxo-4-hydroxy-4-carboxy-5-ureidoimidazoline decarboxylase
VTLAQINAADQATFTAKLGHLFEHSPWIAEETWAQRPFRDTAHLHAALSATMRGAARERQLALIQAHPDLAGRLAQQKQLTKESTKEQATAGLGGLAVDELAEFQRLNDAYRARFGFPFIVCARLTNKASILAAMKARTSNTAEGEFQTALWEIAKIAQLRLNDLLKT